MSEQATTSYSNKCAILAELWTGYKDDDDFIDIIDFNDLGWPLACLLVKDVIASTAMAEKLIEKTWAQFLDFLYVKDEGFHNLEELLEAAREVEE